MIAVHGFRGEHHVSNPCSPICPSCASSPRPAGFGETTPLPGRHADLDAYAQWLREFASGHRAQHHHPRPLIRVDRCLSGCRRRSRNPAAPSSSTPSAHPRWRGRRASSTKLAVLRPAQSRAGAGGRARARGRGRAGRGRAGAGGRAGAAGGRARARARAGGARAGARARGRGRGRARAGARARAGGRAGGAGRGGRAGAGAGGRGRGRGRGRGGAAGGAGAGRGGRWPTRSCGG